MNVFGPFFSEQELGIENAPQEAKEKMFLLVKLGLNKIRCKFGPIKITSGYRSPEHNAEVGGVSDSQHQTGEAVDIMCPNVKSMREVFEWVREFWPGQCFFYEIKGHLHIALPNIDLAEKQRLYCQVLNK